MTSKSGLEGKYASKHHDHSAGPCQNICMETSHHSPPDIGPYRNTVSNSCCHSILRCELQEMNTLATIIAPKLIIPACDRLFIRPSRKEDAGVPRGTWYLERYEQERGINICSREAHNMPRASAESRGCKSCSRSSAESPLLECLACLRDGKEHDIEAFCQGDCFHRHWRSHRDRKFE